MSSIIEPIEQERNRTQSKSILFGIHFLILSKSGRRNHNRPLLDGINRKTCAYETECQCLVKAESEARACSEAPCVGKKFAVVNYPSEKIWLWRSVRPYTLWGEGNHVSVRRGGGAYCKSCDEFVCPAFFLAGNRARNRMANGVASKNLFTLETCFQVF